MQIRVFRTFEWVLAVPTSEVRLGGRNPYKLQHKDTLQRFDERLEMWVDVEVVEDKKPPHPNAARAMQPIRIH
jgi:hypothetical protein